MTKLAVAGDSIQVRLHDVTFLDDDAIAQPVTSGLTGTVTLQDWDDAAVVAVGPTSILLNSGDDWYVNVTAPAAGHYRVIVVVVISGAQRTLAGEVKVQEPPT